MAWATLSAEGRSEPGWHARRIHVASPCDIRAAIAAPNGDVALLFEVQSRSIPGGTVYPDCVGFELMPETMVPGPGGQSRLCLWLRAPRYRAVFETLADDVAAAVAAAASEASGVKALLGRLRTWERFVQRFGPDHLSDEQQLGLFAELRCLMTHLIPMMDTRAAVQGWRGPFGEPQDFRFRAAAIEVKASASRNPQSFQVSNLDQLDAGPLELLLVHHLTLDDRAVSGWTLSGIVAELRVILAEDDPAAASDFDEALIEAGYLDLHRDAYDETRYALLNAAWFDVEGAFPRLTRATTPSGVGKAKYSVILQSCAPHALDEGTALSMVQERI